MGFEGHIFAQEDTVVGDIDLELFLEERLKEGLILFEINFTCVLIFFFEDGLYLAVLSFEREIFIPNKILIIAFEIHGRVCEDVGVGNDFGCVISTVPDLGFIGPDV